MSFAGEGHAGYVEGVKAAEPAPEPDDIWRVRWQVGPLPAIWFTLSDEMRAAVEADWREWVRAATANL